MRTLGVLIGFSWIAFWFYWIAAASRSKPNVREVQQNGRLIRFVFFLPMLILMFGSVSGHANSGYHISHSRPWLRALGVVLLYGGMAIAIWARKYIGRDWGLPMAVKKEPKLITTGPYKRIRHPMYAGLILAPLGTFLALTIAWLFVWLVGSSYFVYSAFQEDKLLAKQFPKTYPAYKARTKMLIPYMF